MKHGDGQFTSTDHGFVRPIASHKNRKRFMARIMRGKSKGRQKFFPTRKAALDWLMQMEAQP